MVSLVDIAPPTRTVEVQGNDLSVHGVSAKGIASLLDRFPEMRLLITGKGADLTPDGIMEMAPDAIAAIIAAGCGLPGDTQAEEVAASLGVGEQVEILACIIELTMPQGIGPFVDRISGLMGTMSGAGSEDGGKAAAGKSRRRSSR